MHRGGNLKLLATSNMLGIYDPCIVTTIVNPETLFIFGEIRYKFLLYQVPTKNGDSTIQIFYLKNENIKTLMFWKLFLVPYFMNEEAEAK